MTATPGTAIDSGARLLAQARIQHRRLSGLPSGARPNNVAEAYACQNALVSLLIEHYGGETIGYKIACTNKLAQELLHMAGPFHGKLLSSFCYDSPAEIEAAGFFMRVMEAEFAFRMGRDLAPGARIPSREEVTDAVEGVLPGIEIVDRRFEEWTAVGAESLIADNACHAAWVKGSLVQSWRGLDLAAQEVRLSVNGAVIQKGNGAAVLGHPLNALHWLAASLHERGLALKAGQYVTTGVTTDI
ncbi:MAG TPA: fumarylacetoacetate hydrolase family protein, partial [Bryobacteraceae bacterium]|nr:fumarylacetoacetate hydrolase family protein [Bryobacteraceae bacterium]